MPRVARPWPTRALWVLEDTQSVLADIDALARKAQIAARDGNALEAVIVIGDIRNKAVTAKDLLSRARTGDYTEEAVA